MRATHRWLPVLMQGGAAAPVPWYLSGGVSAINCIAAYRPKGAVSQAASYINLATNGGSYNAAAGAAAPTWDAANGWIFAAASSQYLTTGITPAAGWSIIARFAGVADGVNNQCVIGSQNAETARLFVLVNSLANSIAYGNGGALNVSPAALSGVFAVAGQQGYRNGTADGTALSAWSGTGAPLMIGARGGGSGPTAGYYLTGSIQAAAIYNMALSAPQVAAISAAMAAL